MRSILDVCEHLLNKHNAEITFHRNCFKEWDFKAATKRGQSQAGLNYAERKQTREEIFSYQGLRNLIKRSILDVCEHLLNERNAKITLPPLLRLLLEVGFQGLRSVKNRSILSVCEDFELERNAKITFLRNCFKEWDFKACEI